MKVFTDTNYRKHGARDLVKYLNKDNGLLNRTGEEMSDEDIEAFIEQSEEYGFERQIIISPEHGDRLSDQQFSHYTRQVMSEFCTDRPTATYCYAIHRDTDHPHAQVAITGTKRDLRMDRADCEQLRDRAHEHFHDQHRELTQEISEQLEAEWQDELAQQCRGNHPTDPEREPEHDLGGDQTFDRDARADAVAGTDRGDGDDIEAEPDTAHEPEWPDGRGTERAREVGDEREHGQSQSRGQEQPGSGQP